MQVVVIGGGPAGLMAAQMAAEAGAAVTVLEAMPACGRKLLVAGSTGLNLSHHADLEALADTYGAARDWLYPILAACDEDTIRAWAGSLGVETFVGSSRRVFPEQLHAAELLKRWLAHLHSIGVTIVTQQRWTGWDAHGQVISHGPEGSRQWPCDATVLALGGASWPHTGSDGSWQDILAAHGVAIVPLMPANCGFDIEWSPPMQRFAGAPLKNIALQCGGSSSIGECVLTQHGIEGQAVYALGPEVRTMIAREGHATLLLDLKRDLATSEIAHRLAKPRGKRSWSAHLRRSLGLTGPAYSLLREGAADAFEAGPEALATAIKALPVCLERPRPIAEAISTAGGIALSELDANGRILRLGQVYACGEMLDWEAPTGGYLLHACLATGRAVGKALADTQATRPPFHGS